nr:Maf family protein [Luteolibacter marinus]
MILASASPRRRELLAAAGVAFEVIASPAEEIHDATIPLDELCERNAELKAQAVAKDHPGAVVIGSDTLVWIDGEPLGKPRDMAQAREMLGKLGGRAHTVCTGVCVVFPGGRIERFHELTAVHFRPLDDAAIREYFEHADPLDKAGAYGIQERGDLIVERIEGAFDNVMGLPVARLLAVLEMA